MTGVNSAASTRVQPKKTKQQNNYHKMDDAERKLLFVLKMAIFLVVVPCSLAEVYQCSLTALMTDASKDL
jgi:hypothetical protein